MRVIALGALTVGEIPEADDKCRAYAKLSSEIGESTWFGMSRFEALQRMAGSLSEPDYVERQTAWQAFKAGVDLVGGGRLDLRGHFERWYAKRGTP